MAPISQSLIVRLVDQVSAPARQMAQALRGIGSSLGDLQDAMLPDGLEGAIARNSRALEDMRGKVVDAVASFYLLKTALVAPISAAADFETALEDIGQKGDIPREKLAALGVQIRNIARQSNMMTGEVAKSVDVLVGMGAANDVAMTMALPINRAAFAYRAASADLAAASWSLVDNLKVPAEQTARAIDVMAKAGKEGAFEIKDMARYFPSVAAMSANLGWTGMTAAADLSAAFQAVRKGAGTSEEAATNLKNVLQKISTPETRKKFKAFGVDIKKMLDAGKKKGESPLDTLIDAMDRAEKKGATIGDIFQDRDVLLGLTALRQHRAEYRRIRKEAMNANGITEEDFARRQATALGAQMRWQAAMQNFSVAIGTSLLPLLTDLVNKVTPIIDAFGRFADANPRVVSAVVSLTAALIGLRVAGLALNFARLQVVGTVLGIMRPFVGAYRAARSAVALQRALAAMAGLRYSRLRMVGDAFKGIFRAIPGLGRIGSIIRPLIGIVGTLARAFISVGVAIMATPIGWIIAGIAAVAAAAYLIYQNWDRFRPYFKGLWDGIKNIFSGAVDVIAGILTGDFGRAWDGLKRIGQGVYEYYVNLWSIIGNLFKSAIQKIDEIFGTNIWENLSSLGTMMYEKFGSAMVEAGRAVKDWCVALPGRIKEWIGTIDLSSLFGSKEEQAAWEKRQAGIRDEIQRGFHAGEPAEPTGNPEIDRRRAEDLAKWRENMGLPAEMPPVKPVIDTSSIDAATFKAKALGDAFRAIRAMSATVSANAVAPAIAGARAAGGAIAAGGTYLVGEKGPELITAGRDGYVHDAAATRRMMSGTGRAVGAAGGVTLNLGAISVTVNGAADPRSIADQVISELQSRLSTALTGIQADLGYTS